MRKGLIDQLIEEDEHERLAKGLPLDVPAWQSLPCPYVVVLAAWAIRIKEHCESPIETALASTLLTWLPIVFPDFDSDICRQGNQRQHSPECILVIPQYVRGKYRFDFAIERHKNLLVLIECDGKEFHSSEEQQARDKIKQESAERDGIKVFRFTGSQIHHRPDDCASDVIWYLQQLDEMKSTIGLDPTEHHQIPAPRERDRKLGSRPARLQWQLNGAKSWNRNSFASTSRLSRTGR